MPASRVCRRSSSRRHRDPHRRCREICNLRARPLRPRRPGKGRHRQPCASCPKTEQARPTAAPSPSPTASDQDRVLLAKWIRRLTNWNGRQAPLALWEEKIVPLVKEKLAQQKTPVAALPEPGPAHRRPGQHRGPDPACAGGPARRRPVEASRARGPARDCAQCPLVAVCRQLPTSTGVALLWRRLGPGGCRRRADAARPGRQLLHPGRRPGHRRRARGRDLSARRVDLRPRQPGCRVPLRRRGHQPLGRPAGHCLPRSSMACNPSPATSKTACRPNTAPAPSRSSPPSTRTRRTSRAGSPTSLGPGDIDRVIIEWRSLLRQIAHAPDLDWPRWRALQALAKSILNETESPTLTDLPPLEYHQTRRVDHRLILRRH